MPPRGTGRIAVGLLVACLAPAASAQYSNPGAYTSGPSAGTTDGPNLLFFGNSFTISSSNPSVHTPSYGGARGIPELVRQVAIAAGHDAPLVKNVFHHGRGYDYHLDPLQPSLGEIDEPKLDGEAWDFVVMQGFSVRPTDHPYLGNAAKLKHNGWLLFDEVRAGTTNHSLQSPDVVPVFYQTWARHPAHWFYDISSPFTGGANIPLGPASWPGPPLFDGAADMASQVRTGYDQARRYVLAALPSARPHIARAGDAWEAAGWGSVGVMLYAGDRYHAASGGDLITALTIYGTIWKDTNTQALVESGQLDATLAAIGLTPTEAALLSQAVDTVLRDPPAAAPPEIPPRAILIDFSQAVGSVTGPEQLPHPGRHYNLISDFTAGALVDAVDTTGQPTSVDVRILDAFAAETPNGGTGAWFGHKDLSGSVYDERAQRDAFFVGRGFGHNDERAVLEVRDLDFHWGWTFTFHGSRYSSGASRVGSYTIGNRTVTLDALENLNLTARIENVVPGPSGRVLIEITNGGIDGNFAYLGVLQIEPARPRSRNARPILD